MEHAIHDVMTMSLSSLLENQLGRRRIGIKFQWCSSCLRRLDNTKVTMMTPPKDLVLGAGRSVLRGAFSGPGFSV